MAKRVLITGGGGFLGGHFATGFSSAGWLVEGVGRAGSGMQSSAFDRFQIGEIGDLDVMEQLLDRARPDVLVHLAGPASVPASILDPLGDYTAHMIPTSAVLEAIRRSGSPVRLILVSSAAVYGNPRTLPVSETAEPDPISPYGFHKVQQEALLDEYVGLHDVRACKARLFSTYGENLRRLAVWEISRRALSADAVVLGTGHEARDYLYAGDVARAMVSIAERAEFCGEAINVASGEQVSISQLAVAIFKLAGLDSSPRFTGTSPPGSPFHWRADVRVLRSLGWEPPAWSRGLARTIEWIRNVTGA